MRAYLNLFTTAVLFASAAVASAQSTSAPPATVEAWRQQYDEGLRAEYGWLSVAGLTFLPAGTYTVGSAPDSDVLLPAGHAPLKVGTLVVAADTTTFSLAPGVDAWLNGQPLTGDVTLKKVQPGENGQPGTPADRVRVGKVEFHLHESGSRLALRVRDPESPIRTGFQGPRWFPVSDGARVIATLKPFAEPKIVDVRNILGDNEPYRAPGQLEFPWDGRKIRVLAFTSTKGRLQLIFRDASVGRETYGTRYAYAEPTGDGRYVIDFNKAYNPPCAYNPYTTCPTPPSQNVLKVAIRAGEKIYDAPHTAASR
jgi:uncharacterized protein (DUF1684 family)